ncbi:hypothetical protein F5Y15DRAFT_255551 [Xylariaceae sp. FL0016]|nr:hypothetical protein F5Y15DRAFT_255551 [Xylariaceae sp. FL0016]
MHAIQHPPPPHHAPHHHHHHHPPSPPRQHHDHHSPRPRSPPPPYVMPQGQPKLVNQIPPLGQPGNHGPTPMPRVDHYYGPPPGSHPSTCGLSPSRYDHARRRGRSLCGPGPAPLIDRIPDGHGRHTPPPGQFLAAPHPHHHHHHHHHQGGRPRSASHNARPRGQTLVERLESMAFRQEHGGGHQQGPPGYYEGAGRHGDHGRW